MSGLKYLHTPLVRRRFFYPKVMGAAISLANFNLSDWSDFFKETGTEWFEKLISDGTIGALKTQDQLVDLLQRHNCQAKVMRY